MNGKFKKVLQDIENTYDTGKIPSRMTLYEFRVMEDIFMELCKSKIEKTLYSNVASYFKSKGFKVDDPAGNEINYIIYK